MQQGTRKSKSNRNNRERERERERERARIYPHVLIVLHIFFNTVLVQN